MSTPATLPERDRLKSSGYAFDTHAIPIMNTQGRAIYAANGADAADIKVGIALDISGPFAALGAEARDGFELAIEKLDDKLGGQPAKVLREDDQLADRTYNVLEQFLDTTEDALEGGGLDEAGTKRAEKFKQQCEMSWKRIDRGRDRDGEE